MELRPEQITIAVTVYSRRDFVSEAIRSALDQTIPVKVIVVEDCGPDATLRDFIQKEFGSRITYFRNPKNRGLFDNWNACLDYCQTPWISILHDDDLLRPQFIASMLELAKTAPPSALYFGRAARLEEDAVTYRPPAVAWKDDWRALDVVELADECFVLFPGQLLSVEAARKVGGFRKNSFFTGDWDMWFRLALKHGAAQSAKELAVVRGHYGEDRGTSRVERNGWKWALDNVQRKRNLALLHEKAGVHIPFDRAKLLTRSPIPFRSLIRFAGGYSRRIGAYNWWLFTHSRAPHWRYKALQCLARFCGPAFFR